MKGAQHRAGSRGRFSGHFWQGRAVPVENFMASHRQPLAKATLAADQWSVTRTLRPRELVVPVRNPESGKPDSVSLPVGVLPPTKSVLAPLGSLACALLAPCSRLPDGCLTVA